MAASLLSDGDEEVLNLDGVEELKAMIGSLLEAYDDLGRDGRPGQGPRVCFLLFSSVGASDDDALASLTGGCWHAAAAGGAIRVDTDSG